MFRPKKFWSENIPFTAVIKSGDLLWLIINSAGYITLGLFSFRIFAAERLEKAGVAMLDVAGAGGTSWTKITRLIKKDPGGDDNACFDSWGIPTADALIAVRKAATKTPLIASGGIRTGIDIAKAIALGASYAGMALPLVAPASLSDDAVKQKIERVVNELKMAMFSCGMATIDQLRHGHCLRRIE